MKHKDFKVGTTFQTCTGQRWRCTDVGKRTILAIELRPELDNAWHVGPPYAVPEVAFDERDIRSAYRSDVEAIEQAIKDGDSSAHPGFPHEAVTVMMDARTIKASRAYPRPRLFRVDRVRGDGEILHPFAAVHEGDSWNIRMYSLFSGTFSSMPEHDFILLPTATATDLKRRAAAS